MSLAKSRARLKTAFARLRRDERGATAIEYSLMASLIAIAILGALSSTGGGLGAKWNSMAAKVVAALIG